MAVVVNIAVTFFRSFVLVLRLLLEWIKGSIRSGGFFRIFTVVFLLFLAIAGCSNPTGQFHNPAGHSLTLT